MRTYALKCPKGKLLMTQLSKRLVGVAASTVLLSLVSATAHAQTIDVLTCSSNNAYSGYVGTTTSTYTFNKSMILNSVGFVSSSDGFDSLSYSINGVNQSFNVSDVVGAVDGIRWLTLSNPTTVSASDVLRVSTKSNFFVTWGREFTSTNSLANVTYNGINGSGVPSGPLLNYSNSNLRVSNPSANVAPEPGTFALALTGGAALLGICIRRRRNAG
jgi:hypothetical protein